MQTEGQTEMAKLKGIFLQYSAANKPKERTIEKYIKTQTRRLSLDVIQW
jgi:hypothetical protein